VTQDDIDNGGVVQPGLTHDNTATVTTSNGVGDDDTETVSIVQSPSVTISKTADVASVDEAGDVINYTMLVSNSGNMTLTGVTVSDPSVDDDLVTAVESGGFNVGDLDQDGKLDLTETWQYTAHYTVTQDDIDNGGVVQPGLTHDNTATVTTAQDASDDASASVGITQSPHVTLEKTATVPGGTADAGETIDYSIAVTNDGNMTLTGVVVSDLSASNLAAVMSGGFNAGDADQDGKLDIGETWQYNADHLVTSGEASAGGSIDNTASVTTAQGAGDSDSASVPITFTPIVDLDFTKAALGYHDLNNNNVADAGDVIDYQFTLHNGGNVVLHTVGVVDADSQVIVTGSLFDLAVGATDTTHWSGSYTINSVDVAAGYKDNTAVASSDETSVSSGTVHVVLAMLNELP